MGRAFKFEGPVTPNLERGGSLSTKDIIKVRQSSHVSAHTKTVVSEFETPVPARSVTAMGGDGARTDCSP